MAETEQQECGGHATFATVSEKLRIIYEKNATESPLLRLPAEIRDRIWRLVLGGQKIHIWRGLDPRGFYANDCKYPGRDEQMAALLKLGKPKAFTRAAHSKMRPACRVGAASSIRDDLLLLSSCRQIHQEAALVPFSDNRFSISGRACIRFLSGLTPKQAQKITTVTISIERKDYFNLAAPTKTQFLAMQQSFNPRELLLLVELDNTKHGIFGWRDFEQCELTRETLERILLSYRRRSLASATVVVYRHPGTRFESLVDNSLLSWAEEIEKQLLDHSKCGMSEDVGMSENNI